MATVTIGPDGFVIGISTEPGETVNLQPPAPKPPSPSPRGIRPGAKPPKSGAKPQRRVAVSPMTVRAVKSAQPARTSTASGSSATSGSGPRITQSVATRSTGAILSSPGGRLSACRVCGANVRPERFDRHMRKVHRTFGKDASRYDDLPIRSGRKAMAEEVWGQGRRRTTDASPDGRFFRDSGRFGSFPSHDDYGDEGRA